MQSIDPISASPEALSVDSCLPSRVFFRFLVASFCVVLVFNYLFFWKEPGVSVQVFVLILTGALCLHRRWERLREERWALILLLGSLGAAAYRFGFSHFVCQLALLFWISGATVYQRLPNRFLRVMTTILNHFRPWLPVLRVLRFTQIREEGPDDWRSRWAVRLKIILPLLIALAVFVPLLGAGNAVFGDLLDRLDRWLHELTEARISEQMFVRLLLSGLILSWFTVLSIPVSIRLLESLASNYQRSVPEPEDVGLRLKQVVCLLAGVNLLFLFTNLIDAVYLWGRFTLPEGLNHSDFVHRGVYSLSAAVVLSAGLLAMVHRSKETVGADRWVQWLSWGWIAQNLVLLAGVAMRLNAYIEGFGWTPKRWYVLFFLVMVLLGYALLGYYIRRQKTFGWLLQSNLLLIFGIFYFNQWVDVQAWCWKANIDRWRENRLSFELLTDGAAYQYGPYRFWMWKTIAEESRHSAQREKAINEIQCEAVSDPVMMSEWPQFWGSWTGREALLRAKWKEGGYVLPPKPLNETDGLFSDSERDFKR